MHIYTFTFKESNGNRGVQKAITNKSLQTVKEMCKRAGATLISYF